MKTILVSVHVDSDTELDWLRYMLPRLVRQNANERWVWTRQVQGVSPVIFVTSHWDVLVQRQQQAASRTMRRNRPWTIFLQNDVYPSLTVLNEYYQNLQTLPAMSIDIWIHAAGTEHQQPVHPSIGQYWKVTPWVRRLAAYEWHKTTRPKSLLTDESRTFPWIPTRSLIVAPAWSKTGDSRKPHIGSAVTGGTTIDILEWYHSRYGPVYVTADADALYSKWWESQSSVVQKLYQGWNRYTDMIHRQRHVTNRLYEIVTDTKVSTDSRSTTTETDRRIDLLNRLSTQTPDTTPRDWLKEATPEWQGIRLSIHLHTCRSTLSSSPSNVSTWILCTNDQPPTVSSTSAQLPGLELVSVKDTAAERKQLTRLQLSSHPSRPLSPLEQAEAVHHFIVWQSMQPSKGRVWAVTATGSELCNLGPSSMAIWLNFVESVASVSSEWDIIWIEPRAASSHFQTSILHTVEHVPAYAAREPWTFDHPYGTQRRVVPIKADTISMPTYLISESGLKQLTSKTHHIQFPLFLYLQRPSPLRQRSWICRLALSAS